MMQPITKEQFYNVVHEHNKWFMSGFLDGKQAEFVNADLSNINLTDVHLPSSIFVNVKFPARITRWELRGANMTWVDMRNVMATKCDLSYVAVLESSIDNLTVLQSKLNDSWIINTDTRTVSISLDTDQTNLEVENVEPAVVVESRNDDSYDLYDDMQDFL
jgi:uncharacterized protein YjbI with pentapeptide repeats